MVWRAPMRAPIPSRRSLPRATVVLALLLAAGFAASPFVLGGCNSPVQGGRRNVELGADLSFDGLTGSFSVSGTADLVVPIADGFTGAIIAPAGFNPNIDAITLNGVPVPITTVVSPTSRALLTNEAQAQGVYGPGESLVFFTTTTPVVIQDGDRIEVAATVVTTAGPAQSPQVGFIATNNADLADGAPLVNAQVADILGAFQPGGDPSRLPPGAAAWEAVNPEIAHSDGIRALPGAPNPQGWPVLHPLQLSALGLSFAAPNVCFAIAGHGYCTGCSPPHADPAPGPPATVSACGHLVVKFLPNLTATLEAPPQTFVLSGGSVSLTATVSTTGLLVRRLDFRSDGVTFTSAPIPPGASTALYTPLSVSQTSNVQLDVLAVDWDGLTYVTPPQTLTVVAPLGQTVDVPLSAVIAGTGISATSTLTGGLPPFVAELRFDDLLVDTVEGSAGPFTLVFDTPSASPLTTGTLSVQTIDSAGQVVSQSSSVTIVPPIGAALNLSASAVPAGSSVSATVTVLGGLPPITAQALVDGSLSGTPQTGASPFVFVIPTVPGAPTRVYSVAGTARDAMVLPQSVTTTASSFTATGPETRPQVVLVAPPPEIQVIAGQGLTMTASVQLGYGGIPLVVFRQGTQIVGADTDGANGFSIIYAVPLPQGGGATQGIPVSLTAEATDSIGQVGVSPPVQIFVVSAAVSIPVIGAAAVAALVALLGGVGAWLLWQRRRSTPLA